MKKTLSLFLSFTLMFSLAACQQTPDEALVVQKDKDRLESAAAEIASAENTLKTLKKTTPKTYNYLYDTSENTRIQAVDVPVQLPDTDVLPTYRVSSGYFSQELVTNIYDFLFQGEETFDYIDDQLAKSQIEAEILKLKQDLAEIQASDKLSEEEKQFASDSTQNLIEEYEDMYEDAPEEPTQKKVKNDSTLIKREHKNADSEEYYVYCLTDTDSSFSVCNYPDDSDSESQIFYKRGSNISYSSGGDELPVTEEEAKSGLADSIGISYDKAKEIADSLLQASGVKTQLVQTCLKAGFTQEGDNSNPYFDQSTLTLQEIYSAFHFYYVRVIDKVDTAFTHLVYSGNNDTAYVSPWSFETIEILVSKNGIEKLNWFSPIALDETLSDNVGLLPFQEAADIFENMMPTIYYGSADTFNTIDITSIKLCYIQTRSSEIKRSGLLVPIWAFYGNWYQKDPSESGKGELHMEPPYLLLAVNAVDGTVINTQAGY